MGMTPSFWKFLRPEFIKCIGIKGVKQMREIKIEELTPEAFRIFGTFTKMTDPVRRGNKISSMAA